LHVDGHDTKSVRCAIDAASATRGSPSIIVARTHIGYGAPNKQDTSSSHGSPLGPVETIATKEKAGWPTEPSFFVPVDAYQPFIEHVSRINPRYEAWQAMVSNLSEVERLKFDQFSHRKVPADLFKSLVNAVGESAGATRKLASVVEQKAAELVPCVIGGSADLNASIMTRISNSTDVRKDNYVGRNLNFGIREHAMSAIVSGLSLSGFFVPFGSTFLIFSDYMRPGIRLSALMQRQEIFVFSHDSIYVGEDGPTHQPIEQISSLRLIPNVHVFRPADGLECAAAWTHALRRIDGPTVLVLCRQGLPKLERPADFEPESMLRGAYVLVDAYDPELVLIATGSEVGVAVKAQELLARENRRIRVVSAPCWEQFEKQPESVQQAILPPEVRRAAFEVGSSKFWRGIVGLDGLAIGIDHFGESAPWERIQSEYGFTAEQVALSIRERFWPPS
jgi:transketolase